ncbi:MAG: flagellar motor stator protein MotA [Alphaproteobacteria bacterium]|nr:flagellar motor stator protein MotA [Alphaproteobacteria bacterium]
MLPIIGIVIILVCVFGTYIAVGGNMEIVMHALPHEAATILGSAIGAFIIANKTEVVKASLKGVKKVFGKPKWTDQDYKDLLSLLFAILKTVRSKGMIALEQHIENPEQSAIFNQYPKIMHDHFALDFICDTLRMMTMNFEDPHQVEDMMEKLLEKHHHEVHAPAAAVQTMADGIPALGIVAAVLGVIKTMGSINAPVEILGAMIGGALVGTFLGVFVAYCFVGPFASKMGAISDTEHYFYMVIKAVLVSHLHGNAPQISVEIGRTNIPTKYQPTFKAIEEHLSTISVA